MRSLPRESVRGKIATGFGAANRFAENADGLVGEGMSSEFSAGASAL
jgi:hypothetical protein